MDELQKKYWIKLGTLFGYPKCCIDAFVKLEHESDSAPRKLHGSGYVPCTWCNKNRTEEQMVNAINFNRNEELKPFVANPMTHYRVSWQSGTKSGSLLMWAHDEKQAYLLSQHAFAVISKQHGLDYLNVTIEPKGE